VFDFNKIQLKLNYIGNSTPATDSDIEELEKYCGHRLPENLRIIFQNYNGATPEAPYFHVEIEPGIQVEMEIARFLFLNEKKKFPRMFGGKLRTIENI
jgi:cell wall assembly regulator SMI1